MARIAGLIAEGLGLPEDEVRTIELAAPLHDIGKIAIPDDILLKAGPLDPEQIAQMRRHPRIGYKLLADSQNRFVQTSALIALRHHERYDGSGYPDGLKGEDIPLAARIVTVADVFDALISPRPYKRAWSIEEALAYLVEQRGLLFDPKCVDVLLAEEGRLRDICAQTSVPAGHPSLQ